MKRWGLVNIWVATVAVVVTVGLLLVYRTSLPPQVPLWYSRPWGEDQLASPAWLWLVPGLIVATAMASQLGRRRLQEWGLLAILWGVATPIVELILTGALIRVVWLTVF